MSPTAKTQKPSKRATHKASKTFTAQERAAMRERAREQKADARRRDGESEVLGKIAEMRAPDRAMAEKIHAILKANAPDLAPRTWYGMPAYAKDDKNRLLLPIRREVQDALRDAWLQRQGEPRRRAHVADRLRADEADRRRREEDRRTRQAGGQLTTLWQS